MDKCFTSIFKEHSVIHLEANKLNQNTCCDNHEKSVIWKSMRPLAVSSCKSNIAVRFGYIQSQARVQNSATFSRQLGPGWKDMIRENSLIMR